MSEHFFDQIDFIEITRTGNASKSCESLSGTLIGQGAQHAIKENTAFRILLNLIYFNTA